MTFVELNTMPFDRVDSDYQLVHATGYAYVDSDGKLTVCYDDSVYAEPSEGDTVYTEDEWNDIVFGPNDDEEDFV